MPNLRSMKALPENCVFDLCYNCKIVWSPIPQHHTPQKKKQKQTPLCRFITFSPHFFSQKNPEEFHFPRYIGQVRIGLKLLTPIFLHLEGKTSSRRTKQAFLKRQVKRSIATGGHDSLLTQQMQLSFLGGKTKTPPNKLYIIIPLQTKNTSSQYSGEFNDSLYQEVSFNFVFNGLLHRRKFFNFSTSRSQKGQTHRGDCY